MSSFFIASHQRGLVCAHCRGTRPKRARQGRHRTGVRQRPKTPTTATTARTREEAMKLIGAGMPRTGTLTQKMALEMLGLGPTYHMVDVLADLDQAALWEQALAGEAPWERIFAGFNSTVDWPGGYFYRELMDVYPDAKVLLSVRDPIAWERSMRQTVWAVRNGESLVRLLSSAQAQVNPRWQGFLNMIDGLLWQGQG